MQPIIDAQISDSPWRLITGSARPNRSSLRVVCVDDQPVVYPHMGTGGSSTWIPAATWVVDPMVLGQPAIASYHPRLILLGGDVAVRCEVKLARSIDPVSLDAVTDVAAPETTETLPLSALVAREVRDLSRLSAQKLGEIFPVERESYQRWMSGKTAPTEANLERLLALRHLFRALTERIANPREWLLAPLGQDAAPTPYELLRTGDVAQVWDALSRFSPRREASTRVASDGTVLTVVEGSLRGRDRRVEPGELDSYDEWLSEDE